MKLNLSRCLPVLTALCLLGGSACSAYREPQEKPGSLGAPVVVDRSSSYYDHNEYIDAGLLVPNADGGTMHIPGGPHVGYDPRVQEAYELKLKARELAAQLFETRGNEPLTGLVAMPTSFVNLDDLSDSNQLGRYLAEAMFYEFNQRSVPVREFRLRGNITLREGVGELALSRDLKAVSTSESWAALLVGTYQIHDTALFINARLVRPADGLVLRTAQLVLPVNSLTASMTYVPPRPLFEWGTLHITSRR